MTALAIAGIVLFGVALAALAVAGTLRVRSATRAARAHGIRGALLEWAVRARERGRGAGLP